MRECTKTSPKREEQTPRESAEPSREPAQESGDELVTALRAKYDAGVIDYSGDTININRNESLQLKLGYNPWQDGAPDVSESFVVYQDPELKHPVEAGYSWDEERSMLTIEPPVIGPAEVDSVEMDLRHLSGTFIGTDDVPGWGNLSQLYLAVTVDTETGRPREGKPLVTILKVKAELDKAPQVKFSQDSSGSARFTWKKVPGAEEYLIFSIRSYDGALESYMNVFASAAGEEWTAQQSMSSDNSETTAMNSIFSQYLVSEDCRGETDKEDWAEPDYEQFFGVIAVKADGSSHISNLFSGRELAHMLPNNIAFNSNEETMGRSSEGTGNLPATMGIVMCDGTISQRVIEYDTGSIEKNKDGSYYTIQGRAYGTPFALQFLVTDQDWNTFDKDLEDIKKRQEKLKNKGGSKDTDITVRDKEEKSEEPEEKPEESGEPEETPDNTKESPDTKEPSITVPRDGSITANSALSEYLAIQIAQF